MSALPAVPAQAPDVTVVDALMGAGKTTLAIRMMSSICIRFEEVPEDVPERFIYITPFLEEVSRVKNALLMHGGLIAVDPQPVDGRKVNHLNALIREGRNVVATHALFQHVDQGTLEALTKRPYYLLIDEVAEWVERYPLSAKDLSMLYAAGYLAVDPSTRRVIWNEPEGGYEGKFEGLRTLCQQGKIVASKMRRGGEPTLLLWQFPVEMLRLFHEVYIFTYLFDGSDMAAYLRLQGVNVRKATIGRDGRMVPYDEDLERERVAQVKPLVRIVDAPSLNAVGSRKHPRENPLSVSWFKNDRSNGGHKIRRLKANIENYFRQYAGTPAKFNLWTTYKTFRGDLAGSRYSRGFESCNARATNKHHQRESVVYAVNLYHHPFIRNYFEDAGVKVSEDLYALLTMVQFVWRSAIRKGNAITVYIPSERMRRLFTGWLDGKLPAEDAEDADEALLESAKRVIRQTVERPVRMTESELYA